MSRGSRQGLIGDRSGGVVGLIQYNIFIDGCQPGNYTVYPHSHIHIQIRRLGNHAACLLDFGGFGICIGLLCDPLP